MVNKGQMLFNSDKCKCLHVVHSYPSVDNSISDVEMS